MIRTGPIVFPHIFGNSYGGASRWLFSLHPGQGAKQEIASFRFLFTALQSFRKLWAVQMSFHSDAHAESPRRMNRVAPWTVLICPKTPSTMAPRRFRISLARSLCIFSSNGVGDFFFGSAPSFLFRPRAFRKGLRKNSVLSVVSFAIASSFQYPVSATTSRGVSSMPAVFRVCRVASSMGSS